MEETKRIIGRNLSTVSVLNSFPQVLLVIDSLTVAILTSGVFIRKLLKKKKKRPAFRSRLLNSGLVENLTITVLGIVISIEFMTQCIRKRYWYLAQITNIWHRRIICHSTLKRIPLPYGKIACGKATTRSVIIDIGVQNYAQRIFSVNENMTPPLALWFIPSLILFVLSRKINPLADDKY
jgi:hypothetical protein